MTQKKTIEITIGQQRLTLKTDQSAERVNKIADLVNSRLNEILPVGQPVSHQVLMLLAMNLADDVLTNQDANLNLKSEVKKRSHAILSQLEKEFPL